MSPSYEFAYVMEEGLGLGILSGLLSGVPSFAVTIATYILTSLALYTLAQRRGIAHPWLSWIPVVNCWILGSLSDQYRYVVKGQVKSKRRILITLSILSAVLTVVIVIAALAMVFQIIEGAMYGYGEARIFREITGLVLSVVGLALPLAGVGITLAVIRFMALYDVYTSCDPGNSVLFLVLSVLIGFTEPFFLFFSRNKDEGMPPRRPEPAYIPPQQPQRQPQAPQQEPWETDNKDYL